MLVISYQLIRLKWFFVKKKKRKKEEAWLDIILLA